MGHSLPLGDKVHFLLLQVCRQILAAFKKTFALAMLMLLVAELAAGGQQKPSASTDPAPTPSGVFAVSGVVLDQSNAPIAGAKVTLYGTSTAPIGGGKVILFPDRRRTDDQLSTTTDTEGKFRFDNVTPDRYQIEVQQEGFKDSATRVRVEPRALAPVRIVLQLAELRQEITVADTNALGRVSGDVAENADVIRLDRRMIDSLPIMGHDVIGAITGMAGSGAGPGGVTLIVDGVPASDLGVPASEIEEVKINQNPYSAEFSTPGQDRIEITTKTGSRHLHGTLDADLQNYRLDARNPFAASRPEDQHLYVDGYLSGPLSRSGKTIFSISGERVDDDNVSVVNALTPSGSIRENFSTPERSTDLSGRINRRIGQENILSLRYNFFDWSYQGEGVGGFVLPEAAANSTSRRHYLVASDRAVLTPNLINEFSARLVTSDSHTQSALPAAPSIEVLGAFTGGGAQEDKHETQNYLQLTDMLSWSRGRHLIKAGVNIPALDRWGLNDRSNFGGTFQFSSLQDYVQGDPFSFVQQQGNSRLVYWQEQVGVFAQDEVRIRPDLSLAFGLRYDWQNHVSNFKNFAPRLSFAFAPGKRRKIVFRGGAGVFYQTTGPGPIADVLRFNGQTLQQIVLSNPSYPDPFSGGGVAETLPSSMVQFAPDLRLPYIAQYSFGIETQLSKSTVFTANYIGSRGLHLFLSRDINAPLPPLYVVRPTPANSMLRQIESSGASSSNSLKLSISTRVGGFFTGRAQYTYGRSYDNTGGINWFPANQYDLAGEWSRSDRNARHSVSFYGTFNVGKLFTLGAILSVRSGLPYTITTGTDVYGTTFANARPAGVPRNSLQGPGSSTLDLRWGKEFSLHKSKPGKDQSDTPKAKIGLDAFNALNHVNFSQPVGNLSSPFYGQPIGASSARRLQISLGFEF